MANFYDFDTAYNFEALNTELRAAFPSAGIDIGVTTGTGNQFTVNCPDNITFQEVETVVNNHNPNALTPEQAVLAVEDGAKTQAQNIPSWATWTEQETINYITANVTDLPSAKVVLIAMARMIVALRNKSFPDLQD